MTAVIAELLVMGPDLAPSCPCIGCTDTSYWPHLQLGNISAAACNQPYTQNTTGSGNPIGTRGSHLAVSPGAHPAYVCRTQPAFAARTRCR